MYSSPRNSLKVLSRPSPEMLTYRLLPCRIYLNSYRGMNESGRSQAYDFLEYLSALNMTTLVVMMVIG